MQDFCGFRYLFLKDLVSALFPRITPTILRFPSNTPAAPKSTLTDQRQSERRRRLGAGWAACGGMFLWKFGSTISLLEAKAYYSPEN